MNGPQLANPHALAADDVLARLGSERTGLTSAEAAARLARHGPNLIERERATPLWRLLARQFASPLIYVLLAAAVVALVIGERGDALFIGIVLAVNAAIGAWQERAAERATQALARLLTPVAEVLRDGEPRRVAATEVVPGDIVVLQSGQRVPADVRLLWSRELVVDESLLTGESVPVAKRADAALPADVPLAERANMAWAGTLVVRGRAHGVVVATGMDTALGQIAGSLAHETAARAPLVERMDRFARLVTVVVLAFAAVLVAVGLFRGEALSTLFLEAVALAVSAIPEGLPVAMTVALALASHRMARRHVIVRRLVAVEALGSCTFIASDKTGTLTVNELTVRAVQPAGGHVWQVTGEGITPAGEVIPPADADTGREAPALERLALAVALANEGELIARDGRWEAHGDAVDVALLVFAHKLGLVREALLDGREVVAELPYESERAFSAVAVREAGHVSVYVKGAPERVVAMSGGDGGWTQEQALAAAEALASEGYRVLAVACGEMPEDEAGSLTVERIRGLRLLGLVALIDPLRPDAPEAIARARGAGLEVAMVTGDHPRTAWAIGRALGLVSRLDEVVSGPAIDEAVASGRLAELVSRARVYARAEPRHKLAIVDALQGAGHFVAVTGDGANDAPALKRAHVGVAMGLRGTDVAREAADLVLADDRFASIVDGIEQGRIAYDNVRRVVFLLVSTGAAEVMLFLLALLAGTPLPLLPTQLLWLNLVTNGVQHVALAFERGEGDELARPPRPPGEPIFERVMSERVVLSALVMGGMAFGAFQWMIAQGASVEAARNVVLLLMVWFENVQALNARSERRSFFALSPLGNPWLLVSVVAAQAIHVAAMHWPPTQALLGLEPVGWDLWAWLAAAALALLAASELHKRLVVAPRLRVSRLGDVA